MTEIQAKVAVVRFPGSNCDLDAVSALRTFRNVEADLVWHEEPSIGEYDAIVLPGGFSFGDYLRAGAIAARSPALKRIAESAEHGTPILGICNGFQILIEAGLLPGSLLRNTSLRFVCKWVTVRVENNSTSFTRGMRKGQVLRIPIAHNEGRFYTSESELREIVRRRAGSLPVLRREREADAVRKPHGDPGRHRRSVQQGGQRRRPDASSRKGDRTHPESLRLCRRFAHLQVDAGEHLSCWQPGRGWA